MGIAATIRSVLAAALTLVALAAPAGAQNFPALTGRVVDAAHALSPGVAESLAATSRVLEQRTSHQLAVAIVPSLDGRSVEAYANGLFRAWRLGRKDENDGVLLLVAPTERKLRIEVGYGLEGVLPDAMAKVIIDEFMLPHLRAGRIDAAVTAGVERISDVIDGRGAEVRRIVQARATAAPPAPVDHRPWWVGVSWQAIMPLMLFPLFIFLNIFFPKSAHPVPASGRRRSSRGRDRDHWSDSSSGSSSSSSSSSDSFSGGGGSSGGGGASGSW